MGTARPNSPSWADALPWLSSGFGEHKAQKEGLDPQAAIPKSRAKREPGLGVVSDIAIDLLAAKWTFSEVFPTYPASLRIVDLNLDTRTEDLLSRKGIVAASDLASMSMLDATRMLHLGRVAISSLAFRLADVSVAEFLQSQNAGLKLDASNPDPEPTHSPKSARSNKATQSADPEQGTHRTQSGRLSVRRAAPLRGRVAVASRIRITDALIDGDIALVRLPMEIAEKAIRRPSTSLSDQEVSPLAPLGAVVVRARGSWSLDGSEIGVVKAAEILSGHLYFEAAAAAQVESILCLALFTDPVDGDSDYLNVAFKPPEGTQVGTNTERMTVTTRPSTVTIRSEPFVTPTRFGYTPVILVSHGSGPLQHLLISAKSLGDPLEEIRLHRKRLTGLTVEIRKESADRSAKYLLSERGEDA